MSSRRYGTAPHLPMAVPPAIAQTAASSSPAGQAASAASGTLAAQAASGEAADACLASASSLHRWPLAAVEQITVALVAQAAADLQRTHDRTRLSKTDIVNRALSLYEFIDAELNEGAELIVRRHGRNHLLKFL